MFDITDSPGKEPVMISTKTYEIDGNELCRNFLALGDQAKQAYFELTHIADQSQLDDLASAAKVTPDTLAVDPAGIYSQLAGKIVSIFRMNSFAAHAGDVEAVAERIFSICEKERILGWMVGETHQTASEALKDLHVMQNAIEHKEKAL
ncbi:hypothetical protein B0A55_00604 [Friedmanniomyces simplex]|uniref:Uncharacterized protein n=1 Tax=Friedmanniomyces simplex TaxID=329884 RepID=A0A4U0Y3D0_9PEZI|nr:hypothetical protein B0A55_00604 [Friedmanniomyces simplex]